VAEPTQPTDPPRGSDHRGLVDRARSRANDTWARVEDARPRIPALDAAFDIRDYDQEVAGGLLAGAIAFRLFLWLVPFALVLVTAAGWIAEGTDLTQADLADRYGVTGIVARSVGDASQQPSSSRLFVLAIALYAMYLASLGVVRALRVAHVLAWRLPTTRFTGSFAAALWFALGATGLVVVAGLVNTARRSLPGARPRVADRDDRRHRGAVAVGVVAPAPSRRCVDPNAAPRRDPVRGWCERAAHRHGPVVRAPDRASVRALRLARDGRRIARLALPPGPAVDLIGGGQREPVAPPSRSGGGGRAG
jgi:hypothetical protein